MSSPSLIKQLKAHSDVIRAIHLPDLFQQNPGRAGALSIQLENIFIDYSKNYINAQTLELLFQYADKIDIKNSIAAMFNGDKINVTENRPVLHTALRSTPAHPLEVNNVNITAEVQRELEKMKRFTLALHAGERLSSSKKKFDTFVNIGIGGSDLGLKVVVEALSEYRQGNTRSFFISNIDYQQITALKKTINPETTLFIISSKSFRTTETLTNANTLKTWLAETGCSQVNQHFFAITANTEAAIAYGIEPENIFSLWDWVGGRFSLWSATGLPIALAIGYENFERLLAGASEMDEHFKSTPTAGNAPIILALLDFWYANFLGTQTHAFIPYDAALVNLPDYLAQLFMESNGKSTTLSGERVDYKTVPVTWGAAGTNAQHAFFQLLHQGTHIVPIDFLAPLAQRGCQTHHKMLLANCLAQGQALMQGECNTNLHRHFSGGRPSTTILYSELAPKTLGALLALFEHRVFVQGLLWQINSFDQWGVELGKKIANEVYESLLGKTPGQHVDPSTKNLIDQYKRNRG